MEEEKEEEVITPIDSPKAPEDMAVAIPTNNKEEREDLEEKAMVASETTIPMKKLVAILNSAESKENKGDNKLEPIHLHSF